MIMMLAWNADSVVNIVFAIPRVGIQIGRYVDASSAMPFKNIFFGWYKTFGRGVAVGLILRYETLLAIGRHHIFMIRLSRYRLGLLGIEMYRGLARVLNSTDISFAYL